MTVLGPTNVDLRRSPNSDESHRHDGELHNVSDHAAPGAAVHESTQVAPATISEVPPYHEIDFDNQEVREFNHEDGEAITVIGKMLVSFFAYSLIVMLLVGLWTYRAYKLGSPADAEPNPTATHDH